MRISPLRSFGVYSYGIYVIHGLFNVLCPSIFPMLAGNPLAFRCTQIAFVPLMIGSTYACAWVSYTYFEQRFLRLKMYFKD